MQKNNVDPTVSDLITATPSDKTVQVKKSFKDNAQDVNEGTDSATTSNAWWISLIVVAFCALTATVVVLLVKKKSYLRFDEEDSKSNTTQTSNKTAVAIEMTRPGSLGSGAKINESTFENPLQAVQVVQTSRPPLIIINKKKASFDSAAAAPPEERTTQSRRIQRKKRSLPTPSTPSTPSAASSFSEDFVTTEMGKGILMYERPDQCRVFELEWKLAGHSKAVLYSFKK